MRKTIFLLALCILMVSPVFAYTSTDGDGSYSNRINISFDNWGQENRKFEMIYYRLEHNKTNTADCKGVRVADLSNASLTFNTTVVNGSTCIIRFIARNITGTTNGTIAFIYYNNNTPVTPSPTVLNNLALFNDTFNDNNLYDNSSGYNWSSFGTVSVKNGMLNISGGEDAIKLIGGWFWSNYSVIYNATDYADGGSYGLEMSVFNNIRDVCSSSSCSGSTSTYSWDNFGANQIRLVRNGDTVLDNPLATLTPLTWYNFNWIANDSNIQVLKDGSVMTSSSDTTFHNGSISMRTYNQPNKAGLYDSILVVPLTNYLPKWNTLRTASEPLISGNIPPTITIITPTNRSYIAQTIDFNFSFYDPDSAKANCSRVINGVNTPLGELANSTQYNYTLTGLTHGSYLLSVSCYDGFDNTTTTVGFTNLFYTINISVFLPNGSAIPNWNITFFNASATISYTNQNNPAIFDDEAIPFGDVDSIISKTNYGDYFLSIAVINETTGYLQFNATLYPYTYVYFFDSTTQNFLSDWQLNTIPDGFNISVGGFNANILNGNFSNGVKNFTASKSGYVTNTTTFNLSNSTSYNITINTTQTVTYMTVVDELTRQKRNWNAEITYFGSNITAALVTAYRTSSLPCLYDGDESSSCFVTVGAQCNNVTNIQGFDYNNATFKSVTTLTTGTGTLKIYINGSVFDTVTFGSGGTITQFSNINNDKGQLGTKTPIITLEQCVGGVGAVMDTREFRMYNNTAGYFYIDNFTVSMPTVLFNGYNSLAIAFKGEQTFEPLYTQDRFYYVSTSQLANFNIVGYILRDSQGYLQSFNIFDRNNLPIQSALLSIGRWYFGKEATIAQCKTGLSGQCIIFLQSNQPSYSTRVSANGYKTQYNESTPYINGQGTSNIYLTASNAITLNNPYASITTSTTPTSTIMRSGFNASCNVSSTEGNINFINFTIARISGFGWNNTIRNVSVFTNSNPSGTVLKREIIDNGQYSFACNYQFVSNSTGNATLYNNQISYSVWIYNDQYVQGGAQTGALSSGMGIIIALGIIIIVCAPIAAMGSPTYAAIIGIVLLVIFAFAGLIPATQLLGNGLTSGWYIIAIPILTVLGLILIRNFV